MNKLPPLNSLRYFLVAAQTLSFKLAAQQLFVTQAAISQHIKTLEAHLGVKLFIRGTRQVTLTDEGKRLLPAIRAGFESFSRGIDLLRSEQNPNILNITVVESLSSRWLVPRLQSFHAKHPDMRVRLEPENRKRNFEGTDLDLGIRFGKGHYPDLESRLLIEDKYVLVCHPSLIKHDMVPADIYELPLLEELGPVTGAAWEAFLKEHRLEGARFNKALEVEDSTVTIIEAVLAGQGIAMLRFNLIYQQIQRKQLVMLFEFSYPSIYAYFLVAPAHKINTPKVKMFETWLLEELADIS